MAMNNVMGPERKRIENRSGETSLAYGDKDQTKKINACVNRNQGLNGPRKRRE